MRWRRAEAAEGEGACVCVCVCVYVCERALADVNPSVKLSPPVHQHTEMYSGLLNDHSTKLKQKR